MCPSDANGVYTLPDGYLAVNAETIEVSQHNPPLEDIETALTARLMRSGAAPMTGPLKLDDGTSAALSLRLASNAASGFYAGPGGDMTAVGVVGCIPIGFIGDYAGQTAPDGWLLCYGQAISRTTYAALFAEIGVIYGAGDGSTTFNVPDLRGRGGRGKLNMGGSSGSAIDTTTYGADPTVLGQLGGVKNTTLVTGNLPAYTPAGTISDTRSWGFPTRNYSIQGGAGAAQQVQDDTSVTPNLTVGVNPSGSITFTGTAQGGSSTPISRIPPDIILNKIIFAGV